MGLLTGKPSDARLGHGPDRRTGRAQAPECVARRRKGVAASLALGLSLVLSLAAFGAAAEETLRLATWHVELERDGPGLLLRDIERGDPEVAAVRSVLAAYAPDIVLLTAIDWDARGIALAALVEPLALYPHRLSLPSNRGVPSGLDLDRDGLLGGPGDAQGYGAFRGQGAMALLARHPITLIADHSALLWSDLENALLFDGMTEDERESLRLFSTGFWEVEVAGLRLFAMSASTPVFDGPEDRNGRRNHDQLAFVRSRLDAAEGPLVFIGNANLDPVDGEGRKAAIAALLTHDRLQDPSPKSKGGPAAANAEHRGDPALDTADWPDPTPGNLRVSYILPDATLTVLSAGVHWPRPEAVPESAATDRPRHHLVWVDLER